ncbi:PREDICTED: Golgi apparatus protein 1 [Nicrophorus vespilloides]|uniref:Golgi apparatus protein 1 n=1 Tax=Nicrophorus vespilloides TaxID=110193 RepID=A0ABM1MH15_NICVS|nr:PREDICTED: Golgi apparatus protein 1 [Nicrophorus vespilloides]
MQVNNTMVEVQIPFLLLSILMLSAKASEHLASWDKSLIRDRREVHSSIVDDSQCAEVKRLCPDLSENEDILVLECLQSLNPNVLAKLNDNCQHVVWEHTRNIIKDDNVRDFLLPSCKSELDQMNCQVESSGLYLKCIVNNRADIKSSDCVQAVIRLENVAFYDYRWIANFLNHCDKAIKVHQCGRIDHDRLSQSETIVCLQNKFSEIEEECKKEVLKLSEIQADSIKLDRQLYMACAEDQMRYCRQFAPGSGRVFNCLLQYKIDKLSEQCQIHIVRRQKLISQDYRISKGLMKSCKDDIKKSHCRRQTSDDKSIRLAQVLLCLENVVRNGTKIDPDCEIELADHRKILMEDFRLSPEIVDGCANEIKKYCADAEVGGKTIHCLMDHARLKNSKNRIGDVCQRALETLVKETDIGEDWRVDPVLHEACNPVVQAACRGVRGGDARVMSCLMDNIGADHMTEECEDALIQIQYFVARDFKLDPQLYRSCREDATRLCHASKDWENKNPYDTNNGPLILPCLYRYAYHEDKGMQLKDRCFDQIKRVMRQRAISVDLLPHVEEACLDDLALFCFDKTARGEEMLCLQDNLDKLVDKCRVAVEKYTEEEAQNTELNPYVMSNCRKIINSLCSLDTKTDEGTVMECLIAHKNDPLVKANNKCRISIEHFQLISLKDFRFSYKFKIACKPYAVRFCQTAKTKAAVVSCLSEKVTNDTIAGVKSVVQKECRQQLKAQLFQQRENIMFDPKLAQACESDIREHCNEIEHGSAQILECLQSTPEKKLTEQCQVELFKVKKQEISDNAVDYALMTVCAESIQTFCPKVEHTHILECLKGNKDERGFNKKCLMIVKHRMIEQNSDYRLNPALQENCKMDIKKFCHDVAMQAKPEKQLNGEVIRCLKEAFKHSKLTNKCEREMSGILREQALDLQLNPLLRAVCSNELETICKQESDGSGNVEECLKVALLNKKIPTVACQNEVASLIEESQADIQVDPLLQQTCSLDILKYCSEVPQGNGRHIKCLKIIMEDANKQLTTECQNMLKKRLEMYKNAAQVAPPENLGELYVQVVDSPAKHYIFFLVIMVIGTMFLIGIFCGRITKRQMFVKNK